MEKKHVRLKVRWSLRQCHPAEAQLRTTTSADVTRDTRCVRAIFKENHVIIDKRGRHVIIFDLLFESILLSKHF